MHPLITQWYDARPVLQPHEPHSEYGPFALRYMLAADVELFGLFSDDELEAVHHAARHAVTGRDMEPKAVDTIAALSMRILAVLERRAAEQPAADEVAAGPSPTQDRPSLDGGTKVPTHPRPSTQPPAAARAVPAWSF